MYSDDTFFHLTNLGQAGLALLSFVFAGVMLLVVFLVSKRLPVWAAMMASLVLFWLFVWLSPQLYYLYYLLLFDGLPVQWVVSTPPGPGDLAALLGFNANANLSDHSKGVLGWLMLATALWKSLTNLRRS